VPVSDAQFVYRSNYAVKLLKPEDQEEFSSQLSAIITATENMEQIRLVPNISVGSRVVIRNGPLAGIEAWVQDREGPSEVILRLDFIGQAAAVSLSVEELQLA
jgi:transcription antitermination factor NusG